MGKWFLSYSSNDEKYALNILSIMESNGHPCFFAKRDINVGESYAGRIMREIEECDQMVLLLSQDANDSQQVLREVNQAVNNRKKILPLVIKPVKLSDDMEYYLGVCQTIDLTQYGPEEYEQVLMDRVFGGQKKKAVEQRNEVKSVERDVKKAPEKAVAQKPVSQAMPAYLKYGQYGIYLLGIVLLICFSSIIEHASVGTVFGWIGVAIIAAVAAIMTLVSAKPGLRVVGIICATFFAWTIALLIFGLLHFILPLEATAAYILAIIVYLAAALFFGIMATV